MKQQCNTSFRWTLGVMAAMAASLALAQAQPQPAPEAPPPAPAHAKPHHPAKQMHKHGAKRKGAGKYATPQQHEAAAAEHHRADPRPGASMDEYQRNALKRCEVFKAEEDRRACAARLFHAQTTGSVEEGGVLRKYTQTIPAKPAQ